MATLFGEKTLTLIKKTRTNIKEVQSPIFRHIYLLVVAPRMAVPLVLSHPETQRKSLYGTLARGLLGPEFVDPVIPVFPVWETGKPTT